MTGWMMPRSRIEAASSSSSSSRNALRGLRGLGRRNSIGALRGRAAPGGRLFAGVADQRGEAAAEARAVIGVAGGFVGH